MLPSGVTLPGASGTDSSGKAGPGNSYIGIYSADKGTIIGGPNRGEGNTIYGSGAVLQFAAGIRLITATDNLVEGNFISGNSASGINVSPPALRTRAEACRSICAPASWSSVHTSPEKPP